jgi:hypothetical protein
MISPQLKTGIPEYQALAFRLMGLSHRTRFAWKVCGRLNHRLNFERLVTDSGEGVCVDPGEREAILGTGGPGPPEKGKGQQLAPDSGGEGM